MDIHMILLFSSLVCGFINLGHYFFDRNSQNKLFYVLDSGKLRKAHGAFMIIIAFMYGMDRVISDMGFLTQFALAIYLMFINIDGIIHRINERPDNQRQMQKATRPATTPPPAPQPQPSVTAPPVDDKVNE